MKHVVWIFFALTLFTSCEEQDDPVKSAPESGNTTPDRKTLESMIKQHIEKQLAIAPNEIYSYHIYRSDLDGDTLQDAIITVNRKENAEKKVSGVKRVDTGLMGNDNCFFYYDGSLNKISPAFTVPSSAKAELQISFDHITSELYNDVLVEYKIINSAYKSVYTIVNHTPRRVFDWKIYSGLGTDQTEAYYFDFQKGKVSDAKDILIKKGILVQPNSKFDIYSYKTEMKKTNELVYDFFYLPEDQKYVVLKKDIQ